MHNIPLTNSLLKKKTSISALPYWCESPRNFMCTHNSHHHLLPDIHTLCIHSCTHSFLYNIIQNFSTKEKPI